MKTLFSILPSFAHQKAGKRNTALLLRFMLLLTVMVILYSVVFQILMLREFQLGLQDSKHHSLMTGFYWVLTVMSTLGFGDIVFYGDLGRAFSLLVLFSGIIFLLVILPFTFIEFFYAPWMAAQQAARTPRDLPKNTKGHVILTHHDSITAALITKLQQYNYPYALVTPDPSAALDFYDQGINVVVGDPDRLETYDRLRIQQAAMVVATDTDIVNTNIAFTVRETNKTVPIVTTSNTESSLDVQQLAGSSKVVQFGEMMGQALARRTMGGDAVAHEIGQFDQLYIAEATANGTPLVGKTIAESNLRVIAGISVVGVWERGQFQPAFPETKITANTVLVLAGSKQQIATYDELFCIYHRTDAPVVIIGGGRVGRSTGAALEERDIDYRIVESNADRIQNKDKYVLGDAADFEVLQAAGLRDAHTVIITSHDDDTNIYLTIYCRRLRPDIQIISRATLERNVQSLHRAGADFVMSYASMGANVLFNLLQRNDILMVAEGLTVFRVKLPAVLAGKTLIESNLRAETGCSVIAIGKGADMHINPEPTQKLEADSDIVLIGSVENEDLFLRQYGNTSTA